MLTLTKSFQINSYISQIYKKEKNNDKAIFIDFININHKRKKNYILLLVIIVNI